MSAQTDWFALAAAILHGDPKADAPRAEMRDDENPYQDKSKPGENPQVIESRTENAETGQAI